MQNMVLDQCTDLISYHPCLAKKICNESSPQCYINVFKECPGLTSSKKLLHKRFHDKMTEEITHKEYIKSANRILEQHKWKLNGTSWFCQNYCFFLQDKAQ